MPHARITHPSRPTLEFRQGQTDSDSREAVTNIAREIGVERPPLVHVITQERTRQLRGRVTAPRRARNDSDTSDWQQALANYIDQLESHCDEFQGFGSSAYTFEDDIRSDSFNVIFEGVEWTLTPGSPYEFVYDLSLIIGRGVMESKPIQRRNPTVQTGMNVPATVGGHDLAGLREMKVSRDVGFSPNAVYDTDSAENNDVVPEDGVQHRIVFRGTHTGSDSQRATADDNLQSLIDGNQVTFQTRFPGYALDGFVTGYETNLESRFGTQSHQFALTFVEGQRA